MLIVITDICNWVRAVSGRNLGLGGGCLNTSEPHVNVVKLKHKHTVGQDDILTRWICWSI